MIPAMSRPSPPRARVGVFAVGLAAYWPQFPGLRPRLEGYLQEVVRHIGVHADVVSAGLVDTPEAARQAGDRLAAEGLDLLVCHTATYATSAQVLPVVQACRAPVLLLNLQPAAALDYDRTDTAEWLANCSACCVPELAHAMTRARHPFRVLSGMLTGDERAARELQEWCQAAAVARGLRRARVGFLGHAYPGMLDMYADLTLLQARLGLHVEVLELDDLAAQVQQVTPDEEQAERRAVEALFTLNEASVTERGLSRAVRAAAGLRRLVALRHLDALAYYHRGEGEMQDLAASLIVGCSLLTAEGVPCAGEGDIKNALAMKILDLLGAGGSYTEFYAMDFREGFVLMGHDGPGHVGISDRRPILRGLPLYHGKAGDGVSVEFNVRTGPVTILGLTQDARGELKLLAAEGESLPGPILRIGNTNSRIRFALPPAEFTERWSEEGPTHHCALGVGHRVSQLEKVAWLLDIPLRVVA